MQRTSEILFVMSIIALLTLGGCGDDSNGPGNSFFVENTLVFERTDGSHIGFGSDVSIWCGPWEEGDVPVPALHIRGAVGSGSYWSLRAVLDDIGPGQTIDFPNNYVWNEPSGVDIFVLDKPNEISTAQPEAHGSITFEAVDCGPPGVVQFSIDAVLGSEYHDGDSLKVYGSFRARFL